MPELPDVAWFKRYADNTALHHRIENVQADTGHILKNLSPDTLQSRLLGHEFTRTYRHGKYLFLHLDSESWLCLHFGMTGDLDYYRGTEDTPPHTRLLLDFENDYHLAYTCRRKLGAITLTDHPDRFTAERRLGPDVLSMSARTFRALAEGHASTVKSWMMDQSVMAGIGNLYADEILFHSRVHPGHKVDRLTRSQLTRMHENVGYVLHTAIDAHADPDWMPADWLLPRRGSDATCPRCETSLKKTTLSGRTTFYCASCQPRPHITHPGLSGTH